jgi:glycosyltransferase involved in cell wall biosynthesis
MKILQVNKFLYPKGGAETYLLALIKLLEKSGQEVVCFGQKNNRNLPRPEESYFIDELDLSQPKLATLLGWPRIFWSFRAKRLITELIKETKPDIVHLHNIYHQLSPSILPAIKRAGIPIIMTVHDFKLITPNYTLRADGTNPPHKGSRLIQTILNAEFTFHKLGRFYERYVDVFIAPSQFVKDRLVEAGLPADKIQILPHFLGEEFLTAVNKKSVRKDRYLLAYGRLDESKGFADLIEAFSTLRISGLKLKIAGAGPEEAQLKKLIRKLTLQNTVELVGQKSKKDLAELIKNSTLIVNPSKVHETFGLAVLEAMALGKAVVASRTGAIPELINDGKNGLLFEAGDIGDLQEQLLKLLSDEKLLQKISLAAKAKAKTYTADRHLKALTKIYQSAIKNQKAPIRRINTFVLHTILTGMTFLLLSWPFYQLDVFDSRAIIAQYKTTPKTANLYWKNPIDLATAKELAKWDVLILDMTAQTYSAEALKEIRRLNPQIIILAYTSAVEMPTSRLNEVEPAGYGKWHELAAGDQSAWHLKSSAGQDITFWAGNAMMNLGVRDQTGRTYGDYLTDFYSQNLMSSGLWDGLFFDTCWKNISWLNKDIDIDGDGQKDSESKINTLWAQYHNDFLRKLRARLGPSYLIITNGDGDYSQYANGRMMESFPEFWEGSWTGQMSQLPTLSSQGFQPRLNIINSDTNNTGNKYDYQAMRFGLTSALLFDAYYSFDYGSNLREHLWWYDEYDVNLGKPLGTAFNVLNKTNTKIVQSIWQREFENGIVLVNSTDQPQKISFEADYEKLRGTQDKETNSGGLTNQLILPANDGIILLKQSNKLFNTLFVNGSFARIFDASGQTTRNGFFVYENKYNGGNKVLTTDFDGDSRMETITTDKNSLNVWETNGNIKTIYPYGQNFTGGLNFTIMKTETGQKLLAVAPDRNGSNLIKFYNTDLSEAGGNFTAYSTKWKNLGANLSACDINHDGADELVVGAGYGGGPHVKIFNRNGTLLKEWFAYKSNFRGGVYAICGQIDESGENRIVTGTGPTGGPHVKIFDQNGTMLKEWFAYGLDKRDGVKIALTDLDGNGIKEIIALTESFLGQ